VASAVPSAAASAVQSTVDSLIAALAGRQHGLVTRQQLVAAGLASRAIDYRLRTGRLHRIHAGVYAVGHRPVSPHAYALAAVLACGPGAALSHGSAVTLWGLSKHWRTPREVTTRTARQPARVRVHRSKTLTAMDVTDHYGIPVTTPARTLLDIAERLTDPALARAVNDLRLARYLSLADLAELLDRHAPTRATKRLRPHLAHPHRAPTRSEFEDAFLAFAQRHHLPEPEVNTLVAGHEADIYFPEHRLVVELDSHEFHAGRRSFESDRDRDADLLAAAIATARVTWERLSGRPAREAARLHAILAPRAPEPRSGL
jgi:predicted transcriptional regulator of viral defense system